MKLLNAICILATFLCVSIVPMVLNAEANETNTNDTVAALILDSTRTDDISRLAVIESAGNKGQVQYIPQLLYVAESEQEMRGPRYRAMIALGELKAVESIPLFRSIIKAAHTDRQSSWGLDTYVGYAFDALASIGTDEAVAILVDSFQTLDQMDLDHVQLATLVRGLGNVKHVESVERIGEILVEYAQGGRSVYVGYKFRKAAIYALSEIGTLQALNSLSKFARSVADEELSKDAHRLYLKAAAEKCRGKLE